MVDNCKHVLKLTPASDHSVLNPQKWACKTCATTESVWACLSCPHVACGRYIQEHALQHYEETKHPLSLEVNEKYVFCYECNDYVLNDNAAGDVKILRCALSAVTSQSLVGVPRSSKRLLRSQSFVGFNSKFNRDLEQQLRREDRNYTALWFRRYYQMAKAFSAWKQAAGIKKKDDTPEDTTSTEDAARIDGFTAHSPSKKRALIPGITGLRNLGNTCYMNSVLQVLSHLRDFREFFLQLKDTSSSSSSSTSPTPKSPPPQSTHQLRQQRKKQLMRQTTMECFQHVSESGKKGGLNGGSSVSPSRALQSLARAKENMDNVSLCQELHALLRVMWSGKWALVSPHKMLYAVWNIIPFFRGYSQQDAQEFLCAFLDKVSSELEVSSHVPSEMPSTSTPRLPHTFQDIVSSLFQGQVVSELTCLRCKNQSPSYEPFMDLSLEFPSQSQATNTSKISTEPCHLEDMLGRFTSVEKLDEKIECSVCNTKRRRAASPRPTQKTLAQKRLILYRLPHVLRLHLKRFMWSGRNNRGKITVHAQFERLLDLKPFCHPSLNADTYLYQLSAVVMHHGRGFGSGHYTAYCWNEEADSWVHCNDAKLQPVSEDTVMKAQAYILFYTRRKVDIPDSHLAVPLNSKLFHRVDEDIAFRCGGGEGGGGENGKSGGKSQIPRFREHKRKLSMGGQSGQRELKRRKSNMW